MTARESIFLPQRPLSEALFHWMAGSLGAALLLAGASGTVFMERSWVADDAKSRGAEAAIELVEFAAALPRVASKDDSGEDRAAKPALRAVEVSREEQPDRVTEQVSPADPDDPALRMARERTAQVAEAPPDERQTTEASQAVSAATRSQASAGAEAVVAEAPMTVADRATAPEQGNAREAVRRAEAWQRALFGHIARFKTYPEASRQLGSAGDVLVFLTVGRDGRVQSVRVEKSSGHADLDLAAMEVLRRANPLPRPPATLAGEAFAFLVPLKYRLK